MNSSVRTYYKEEQNLRNSPPIWILYLVFLAYVILSVWSLYQQIDLGKQVGDHPASDKQLELSMGIGMAVFIAVIFFIHQIKLITIIDSTGIQIKFKPIASRSKYISKKEINRFEVRKYKPIAEYGGWGSRARRNSLFRPNSIAYNMNGNIGLQLYLSNNRKILIGTQNPSGIERAMKKLMKEEGGIVDG